MIFLGLWDGYDKSNDKAAKLKFLDSLQRQLRNLMKRKFNLDKDPYVTFAEALLIFIEEIQPRSTETEEALELEILAAKPADFPGHDVSAYVEFVEPKLERLTSAHAWDSTKNTRLCRMLALAGGAANTEYNQPLYTMLTSLNKILPTLRKHHNGTRHELLLDKELSWFDILTLAKAQYKSQMVAGMVRWPFVLHAHDSKAPPANFRQANLSPISGVG